MTSIKKKSRFFAVRRGRRVGIYTDYAEYQEQVLGYSGFEARTFYSRPRAEKWLKERQQEEQEEQDEQARRLAAMSIHDTGKNNTANDKNDSKNPNDKNKNHKNKNGKNPNESASKKGSPRPFLKSAASNQRADPLATIGQLLPPQKPAESADSAETYSALVDLAMDSLPSQEEDDRIELAKSNLVMEMWRWNRYYNEMPADERRRRGFSRQLAGARWSLTLKAFGSYASRLHSRGSDIDLQVDGTFYEDGRRDRGRHALEMCRADAQKFIHVFGANLSNKSDRQGKKYRVEKVPRARMPILKVQDLQLNVSCDIAFPNEHAVDWPKSELLLVLNHLDVRLRLFLALVKMWAGASQLRDAALGRFNTYTLTMLSIYYLQTRQYPVLPPLEEIIPHTLAEAATRYQDLSDQVAEMASRARAWRQQNGGQRANPDGLAELFVGFLEWLADTCDRISGPGPDRPLKIMTRTAQCCEWDGIDRHGNVRVLYVEDPFDSTDNSARALTLTCLRHAGRCARDAHLAFRDIGTTVHSLDEWMHFVFRDGPKVEEVKKKKKKARSRRGRQTKVDGGRPR